MRSFVTSLTLCALLVFSLTAIAQQQPPAPGGPPPGAAPAPGGPPAQAAEKNYAGTLAKVDLDKKEITVKGTDNKDMVFTFTDTTQMTGIEQKPQGLSGKTGSNLKITYRENRGANVASKIEVEEKK
jgi:hypothetical protein